MSFGPGLAVQRDGNVFSKQTVPAHRVGPGFAGISNSTELGHGLGSPGCRPTGSSGAPGRAVVGPAVEGEGARWVSVPQQKVAPFWGKKNFS